MANHQVIFSVPEPGIYDVNVADGKSCSKTFQIDMSGCDATDNLLLSLPAVSAASGSTITLPLSITNGSIFDASFSVAWDTAVLQFSGLKNLHPALHDLALDMNNTKISAGQLGLTFSNYLPNPPGITIPNGETMMELEFVVAGPDGATSGVAINNSLAPVGASDTLGNYLAVSARNGRVDVVGPRLKQKSFSGFVVQLAPNVIPQGSSAALLTKFPLAYEVTVRLCDLTGRIVLEHRAAATAGVGRLEIPTNRLPGGLYFVLCMDEMGQVAPPQALMIQGQASGF